MEDDLFVAELPHMLYRGDTPLHLAAADPPEPASSRSRWCGCSSPPARPWPTPIATASPWPTGSRARPCERHWPPGLADERHQVERDLLGIGYRVERHHLDVCFPE